MFRDCRFLWFDTDVNKYYKEKLFILHADKFNSFKVAFY